MTHHPHPRLALLAAIFGAITIFAGGSVLFGPEAAQERAGQVVPFVLWFNAFAGFAYLVAGWGLWRGANWAVGLAWAIAGATVLVGFAFAVTAATGTPFEPRTVGALILRATIWAAIAWAAGRGARK